MPLVIKKTISALALPVPIILVLLIIGVILLFVFPHGMSGKILTLIATVILVIFTTPFLPNFLVYHLEKKYKPLTTIPKNVDTIVVLGAGNGGSKHYPANNQLSSASLARLIEGIRLHKLSPHTKLILSGGRIFGSPADGAVMNNVATMLGVNPADIIIEAGSQDTYQEAANLKSTLQTKRFILVTSAYHMPRAMALFEHQGMHPIAAPTQLLLRNKRYSIKHYLPNSSYLLYSDIAIHEYFGLIWSKLTNRA